MGRFTISLRALVLALALVVSLSCVFPNISPVVSVSAAAKVKINKTKASLESGASMKLKVSGTSKKVTWISSKKSVAAVSSKGVVTAKRKGKAVITAKVSGKSYTCKVTVTVSDIAKNISELKNYISESGTEDQSGGKLIKTAMRGYTWGIVYASGSDTLSFVFTDAQGATAAQMTISSASNSDSLTYDYTLVQNSCAFTLQTTVDPYSYDPDQNYKFTVVESASSLKSSQVQELGNVGMQAAFSGWNLVLYQNLGIGLADIGFKSYK